MKNLLFGVLFIALAVAGSAFTSSHSRGPNSFYYLALVGSNYVTTSSTLPTTQLCTNTHTDPCEGKFNVGDVNVVDNHDGTSTYTPKTGIQPINQDFRN